MMPPKLTWRASLVSSGCLSCARHIHAAPVRSWSALCQLQLQWTGHRLSFQLFALGTHGIVPRPLQSHVVRHEIYRECCRAEIGSLTDPCIPSLLFGSLLAMGDDNIQPSYRMSHLFHKDRLFDRQETLFGFISPN